MFAAIACLALVGAGCSKEVDNTETNTDTSDTSAPLVEEVQDIKVAIMGPLSGDAAVYGDSVRRGVGLAKDLGKFDNIELVFEDSKCEGKDAAAAINKLISVDGVDAIIGELCSSATLAATPIANQNKVVMISPGSTAPSLTEEGGEYFFRTVPSDALQGAFGAELVAQKGYKKLAVLYVNDDYGAGFDSVLKEEFPKHGGEVVASEAVERKATDLRAQLTKIKAAEADSLYIISNSPDTASAALKQITELGIDAQVFGSEGLKNEDIVEAAQGGAEGMILTTVSSGNDEFNNEHFAMFGAFPGPFAAQGYDALWALGWASSYGAGDGEALKNKLHDADFDGASGHISFDENGDVAGNYNVYEVVDGDFLPAVLSDDEPADE